MRRPGRLALCFGLAALLTWPALLEPGKVLLGSPDLDVWNHAWGPWWWAQSLRSGAPPWRTTLLRWPEGGVLWFIDPLLALPGALAILVGGAPVAGAWNGALFASIAATAWAGTRWARALGARAAAGEIVAATALAGSAWVVDTLHDGISEALHLAPLTLAMAWTEEALASGALAPWAKAGLALGITGVGSPYFGLAGALAVGVRGLVALAQAGRRGRPALIRGGLTLGLLAVLIASPAAWLLHLQLAAPDALVRRPEAMDETLALHNAVDPRVYLAPLGFQSQDLSAEGWVHTLYLGWVALGLAIAGRRARGGQGWVLAGLVCAMFSLGPWLYWGGSWADLAGHRVPLPWRLVQALAPSLALTHPLRLGVPLLVVVAGRAGLGAERLLSRTGRLAGLATVSLAGLMLLDSLRFSGAPWPVATAPAELPAVFDALVRPPEEALGAGVLDLPTDADATMRTSRYLYWQTGHGRPIPYAPDARASTSSLLSEPAFRVLAARCARRADEARGLGLSTATEADFHPERLRDLGYRWIVLHRDLAPETTADLEALLTSALGPGKARDQALLWDLSRH